jgi:hypothetical protein
MVTEVVSPAIRREFEVHLLNADGIAKAGSMAAAFTALLNHVEMLASPRPDPGLPRGARELALVRTHLELASFYAKKAMASQPENQA